MRHLTISIRPNLASIYVVQVSDDFDAQNPDLLQVLAKNLCDVDPNAIAEGDPIVFVESDEPVTPALHAV